MSVLLYVPIGEIVSLCTVCRTSFSMEITLKLRSRVPGLSSSFLPPSKNIVVGELAALNCLPSCECTVGGNGVL